MIASSTPRTRTPRCFTLLGLSLLLLGLASPFAGAAPINWTGGGDGTNFSDAANWAPAQVPGVNDEALITTDNFFNIVVDGTFTVQRFEIGLPSGGNVQTVSISGASRLVVTTGSSLLEQTGRLVIDGGGELSVQNPATVTMLGSLQIGDMQFTGDGLINMGPGLGFSIDNPFTWTIDTATVILQNQMDLTIGVNMELNNGATFTQNVGVDMAIAGTSSIGTTAGTPGTFNVNGTLYIGTAIPGRAAPKTDHKMPPTLLSVGARFNNGGTVEIGNSFEMILDGDGNHTGTFITNGIEDSLVITGGTHTADDVVFHRTRIEGGQLNLLTGHQFQMGPVIQSGGIIDGGTNTITIEVPYDWQAGTIQNAMVNIGSVGTIGFSGPGTKTLRAGTLNMDFGGSVTGNGPIQLDNATVDNRGTFNIASDGSITALSVSTFNNFGLIDKTLGGDFQFDVPFVDQDGASGVTVNAARLNFNQGGRIANTLTIGSTSTVELSGQAFDFNSANLAGTGEIRVDGPLAFNNAQHTFGGTFNFQGGSLGGSGSLSLTGPANWTGGAMIGPGIVECASGCNLDIATANPKELNGAFALNNNGGTITILEDVVIGIEEAAQVTHAGGTFQIFSGARLLADPMRPGGVGFINLNSGAVVENNPGNPQPPGTVTEIMCGLNQNATFDINFGEVRWGGPGSLGATNNLAAGTVLVMFGENKAADGSVMNGPGGTVLNGGTLAIGNDGFGFNATAPVTIDGTTITGPGPLNTSGPVTWTSGGFDGLGAMPTPQSNLNGPSLTIQGGTGKFVRGGYEVNTGAPATFSDGSLELIGTLNVQAGGSLTVTNAPAITLPSGTGLLDIAAGASLNVNATGTFFSEVPLNSVGNVSVTGGVFSQRENLLATDIGVTAGATLEITAGNSVVGTGITLDGTLITDTAAVSLANITPGVNSNVTVRNNGNLTITAPVVLPLVNLQVATLTLPNGLTIGNQMLWDGGTINATAALQIGDGAEITTGPTASPRTLNGNLTILNNGEFNLTNSGTVTLGPSASIAVNTGGRMNINAFQLNTGGTPAATLNIAGELNKIGAGTSTINLPTTLSGTMRPSSNQLSFTDSLTLSGSAAVLLEGGVLNLAQPLNLVDGTTLNGPGTVIGGMTNNGAITVGSGAPGEQLAITGDYTQSAGGELTLNVQDQGGNPAFDLLNITGTANFGGDLLVNFIANYEPPTGLPLNPINFTTLGTGVFNNNTVNTPAGSTMDITIEPTNVTLINNGPPTSAWTGGTDTDWHNPANWNPNAVPGPNTNVTIEGSVVVQISTQPAFAQSITLGTAGTPTLEVNNQVLDTQNMNINTNATLRLIDSFLGNPGSVSPEKRGIPLFNSGSIEGFGGSGIGLVSDNQAGGTILVSGDTNASANNAVLVFEQPLTNTGAIILSSQTATDSGLAVNNGGLFTNNGTINLDAAAGGNRLLNLQLVNNGTVSGNANTSIAAGGGSVVTNKRGETDVITNNGSFSLDQSTLTIQNGDIRNAPGAVFDMSGSIQFPGAVIGFSNEGTLRVAGPNAGTLQIGAPFTNSGLIEMELDGRPKSNSDQINITADATLAGTLTTSFLGDPQDGSSFTLFTYSNRSGDFASVTVPPFSGLEEDIQVGETNYVLAFNAPQPITDPQVYVLDTGIPGIVSLDAATGDVNTTLSDQFASAGIATTPGGDFLFVASPIDGTIRKFETETNTVVDTITAFPTAFEVAVTPDDREVWFLLDVNLSEQKRGLAQIGVYDQATQLTRTLSIPCASNAETLLFHPTRRVAYTIGNGGSVCEIDTVNDSLINSASLDAGFSGAVMDPSGDFIYAFEPNLGQLFRITTDDFAVETFAVPGNPYQGAIYNNQLFITNQTAAIHVFDLDDDSLSAIPLPGAQSTRDISIFDEAPLAYVTDQNGSVPSFDPANLPTSARGGGPFVNPVKVIDSEVRNLGPTALALDSATFSVPEDVGTLNIPVNRTGVAWGSVSVTFSTQNGSALASQDFSSVGTTLSFNNGNESQTVGISIIDDSEVEDTETFTVIISAATNNGVITIGSATVTIVDNDNIAPSGTVQLSSAAYNTTEGEGTVVVTVVRGEDSTSETTASVTLVTSDGAAAAGLDYGAVNRSISFPPGTGSVDVSIPIVDDVLIEDIENFTVSLQDPVNTTLGTPNSALVLIGDNDFQTVAWTTDSQTITEGTAKTAVTVTAVLGNGNPNLLSVPFSVGGSATAGVDHTLTQQSITFQPGQTTASITFNVIEDSIQEGTETIRLQLLPTTVVPALPATQLITILDDDDGSGGDGGDGGDGTDGGDGGTTAPDTSIPSPADGSEFQVGQSITFQAAADSNDGTISFAWEICASSGDCRTLSGATVNATFQQPGLYVASCVAIDALGNRDLTPARVRIRVREALRPDIQITQPDAAALSLTRGDVIDFIATTGEETAQVRWYFIDDPSADLGQGTNLSLSFPNEGRFTLVAEAISSNGTTAADTVNILVSPEGQRPVEVAISRPEPASVFSVGDVINFEARVSNPDKRKKELEFFWDFGNGTVLEGIAVTNTFSQPGRYRVTFVARDEAEDLLLQDSVAIYVFGNMPPEVDINQTSDIQIEPFSTANQAPGAGVVFFQARVRNPRGFRVQDLNFFWDFGDGRTSTQETPGRIEFREEGTFTVSLFARTRNGLVSETVSRTVTVRQVDENTFEPNETFGQAKPLPPGNYNGQTLPDAGSVDVYRINVERDGQSIVVKCNIDGTARVELYDGLRQLLNSRIMVNQGSIQLNGLRAGDYFLRITQIAEKAKRMLSYGFSVSVLNPGLYLADIQSNEFFNTEIGIVNTTNSEISVEAIAYDAAGNILARAPFTLAGNGRTHQEVSQFFDGEQLDIAWVQVDATGEVAGYARTCARDGKEEYLITAGSKLSSELFVPHIAEKVDQWFTRASVVNATDNDTSGVILTQSVTEGAQAELTLTDKFSQDQFDFLDRFGGTLPTDQIWAKMTEADANNVLVGSEVFGTVDGSRVSAGLELVDTGEDNPNFTFVPNTLYFTHIARDINQFWTGIALVNIGEIEQGTRIKAYGPAGNLVGEITRTLAGNEKLVVLARDLLAEIGSPADIDWLEVVADADVVGFELFGTHNQKQMAGLEATTGVRANICFPFFDSTNRSFQGISVVNVNDSAQTVTFTLYNDRGEAIQTATRQLAPRQKLVETISELLPATERDEKELPGWLEARADAPLAGFQLIIGKDGEQMSALKAQ